MKKTVITLGLILLSVTGFCGCGSNRELTELLIDDTDEKKAYVSDETITSTGAVSSEEEISDSSQLTALADTLEEAQEIADLYGIELDTYSYGVATYHTDKDISDLIQLGLDNDYPTLAPNTKDYLNIEQ